jgi:hypothetical protein
MFVECQIKVEDPESAVATLAAIREEPGLEKRRALGSLADRYEKAGDQATARSFLQQCLRIVDAKRPANDAPPAGKFNAQLSFSARSFVDYEHESNPILIDKEMTSIFLHARLGDMERAMGMARAMHGPRRNIALSNLAGHLARQGDIKGAMNLAASFETDEQRLTAIQLIACAVRDGETVK